MNIYLTEKTHKSLCELFDIPYTPMEFEPIEVEDNCVSPTNKGIPHTKESIELIRISSTGKNNGMYGRKHTEEAKKIMAKSASERFKGKSYEEIHGKQKAEELKKIRSEQLKGIDNFGKKNPRFDFKEYTFFNIETNEKITSTRYDFYTKYGINKGGVSEMVNKGITYKKWCVVSKQHHG